MQMLLETMDSCPQPLSRRSHVSSVVRKLYGSGLRAESANRFLKLPRGEVKVGLNFRGEMGVVLEPKPMRNDLQREALGDEAAGEKHAVSPEQFFGAEPRCSLNRILQLPVGKPQVFGNSRDRKLLFLGELKQVLPIRTPEVLPFARDREFRGVLGHRSGKESFSLPDIQGSQQAS